MPLYTCPMDAEATGSMLSDEKTSSILMPSSSSMTCRPSLALNGGTASCNLVRPLAYVAGKRSVRVLSACPT
jgi:hypothetical protein